MIGSVYEYGQLKSLMIRKVIKKTVYDTFYPLTRSYFMQNNFVGARVLQHLLLGYKQSINYTDLCLAIRFRFQGIRRVTYYLELSFYSCQFCIYLHPRYYERTSKVHRKKKFLWKIDCWQKCMIRLNFKLTQIKQTSMRNR